MQNGLVNNFQMRSREKLIHYGRVGQGWAMQVNTGAGQKIADMEPW